VNDDDDVFAFFVWLRNWYRHVRPVADGRWAGIAELFGNRGRIVVGQVGDCSSVDLGY
jgi:hypothetical protein